MSWPDLEALVVERMAAAPAPPRGEALQDRARSFGGRSFDAPGRVDMQPAGSIRRALLRLAGAAVAVLLALLEGPAAEPISDGPKRHNSGR